MAKKTLPLYAGASQASLDIKGHTGLWFDKFCNTWRGNGDTWSMAVESSQDTNPKLAWIEQATKLAGDAGQISELTNRVVRLVERHSGLYCVFTTESRFVTGLGRSHPIENGFAWHPTLGTPYLPGSSVKGLVRAWLVEDSGEQVADGLLGGGDSAGLVCFLDAIPTEPVKLEADVMTPHYAGWCKDDPPGDWRSPTPIPFLATAKDTSFLFAVLPQRETVDLQEVEQHLVEALRWLGAGAKTAVGYGRFALDEARSSSLRQRFEEEDRQRQEEARREAERATPEGRWRLEFEGKTEQQVYDVVRETLDSEALEDPAERQAFIDAFMETGLFALWRAGQKREGQNTQPGPRKLKDMARRIEALDTKSD